MDKEYFGQETFFEGQAPLPEWAGYLIVIGFGAFFSLFTWAIMALDRKYVGTKLTSASVPVTDLSHEPHF